MDDAESNEYALRLGVVLGIAVLILGFGLPSPITDHGRKNLDALLAA